jgi:hypothetical protein
MLQFAGLGTVEKFVGLVFRDGLTDTLAWNLCYLLSFVYTLKSLQSATFT